MELDYFRDRPYLTGLLLGSALWLIAKFRVIGLAQVALVFLGVGVVLAVWGEDWYETAGKALAAAGATLVLIPILIGLTATQDAFGL